MNSFLLVKLKYYPCLPAHVSIGKTAIDRYGYSSGIYLFNIVTDKETVAKRAVKQ